LADATQNDGLIDKMKQPWSLRPVSALWNRLHACIIDDGCWRSWAADHHEIFAAIEARESESAPAATWRHPGKDSCTSRVLSNPDTAASMGSQSEQIVQLQ
jgi:GntR family uxuAB operon transcriptional repressor